MKNLKLKYQRGLIAHSLKSMEKDEQYKRYKNSCIKEYRDEKKADQKAK